MSPKDPKGRHLIELATNARESGDFIQALVFEDQALVAFQEEGDLAGLAETQAGRFLTFRHLAEKTGDRSYLILAKYAALSGVEISTRLGDKTSLAIPFFNLAKAQQTLGEVKEAVKSFREALKNITENPPKSHNRPAVIADFKLNLSVAEYLTGDKSALDRARAALKDLERADEDSYNKNVWLASSHIKLAEALKNNKPTLAQKHLLQSKAIIDSDPRLKLIAAKWDKLSKTFEKRSSKAKFSSKIISTK